MKCVSMLVVVAALMVAASAYSFDFDSCDPFTYNARQAEFSDGIVNRNSGAGHALWFPSWYTDDCTFPAGATEKDTFIFVAGHGYGPFGKIAVDLVNRKATLRGLVQNRANPDYKFIVKIDYSNFKYPGEYDPESVHFEMYEEETPIWERGNSTNWVLAEIDGTFTGVGPLAGNVVTVTTKSSHKSQFGFLANGKNFNLGNAFWFTIASVQQGSGECQVKASFSASYHGDFNMDLWPCEESCPPNAEKATDAWKLPGEDFNVNAGDGFSFWIDDWNSWNVAESNDCGDLGHVDKDKNDFKLINGAFQENVLAGTARLTGRLQHVKQAQYAFDVDVQLSGRHLADGTAAPHIEFTGSAKDQVAALAANWAYYSSYKGVFVGVDALLNYRVEIVPKVTSDKASGLPYQAQVGQGANGKNFLRGSSAWFTRQTFFKGQLVVDAANPAGQPTCGVKSSSKHGDWNINLSPCVVPCVPGHYTATDAKKLPGQDYNPAQGNPARSFSLWLDDWNAGNCGDLGDVDNEKNDFSFALGYGYSDFGVFVDDALTGKGSLNGFLQHGVNPEYGFLGSFKFEQRVQPGDADYALVDPHFEFATTVGSVGPANEQAASAKWVFYRKWSGVLTGVGKLQGYTISLWGVPTNNGKTYGFQIGEFANGKNVLFGASGWFHRKVFFNGVEKTVGGGDLTGEPECKVNPTNKHGDINININICKPCEDGFGLTALPAEILPGQNWNPYTGGGHAVWLQQWFAGGNACTEKGYTESFVFGAGAGYGSSGNFVEIDGDSAGLFGLLHNTGNHHAQFELAVKFSNKVQPGDADYNTVQAHFEMIQGYGQVFEQQQSTQWVFYKDFEGVLTGRGLLKGYTITIRNKAANLGFQVGLAASGKNILFGASGWFVREAFFNNERIVDGSFPIGQPACYVQNTELHGDININFKPCLPCPESGFRASDSGKCDGDYNPQSGSGFSFWLDGWRGWNDASIATCGDLGHVDTEQNDFSFVPYASLGFESASGVLEINGETGKLTGVIAHIKQPQYKFKVEISLWDYVAPGDADYNTVNPHFEMYLESGKTFEQSQAAAWTYFKNYKGTLTGLGALCGYELVITPLTGKNFGFQIGIAGNGKNFRFGASGWFARDTFFNGLPVVDRNAPAGQPHCNVAPSSKHGDININLDFCPLCPGPCVPGSDNLLASAAEYTNGVSYNKYSDAGHALWLQDWNNGDASCPAFGDDKTKNDFVFTAGYGYPAQGVFKKTGADSAVLVGYVQHINAPSFGFIVQFNLYDLVAPGDADYSNVAPHYENLDEPGKSFEINNSPNWIYFRSYVGELTGVGALQDYRVDLTNSNMGKNGKLYGFQVGLGANGKNLNFGASAWFNREVYYRGIAVVSNAQPAGQPSCGLHNTNKHGDINIDLTPCPAPCPSTASKATPAEFVDNISYNPNTDAGHAVWLQDWHVSYDAACFSGPLTENTKNDFVFAAGHGFPAYGVFNPVDADHATLSGYLVNLVDSSYGFKVQCLLHKTSAAVAPHYEMFVDPGKAFERAQSPNWSFYQDYTCDFVGVGRLAGYKLHAVNSGMGNKQGVPYGFQFGLAANGKNVLNGASSWFTRTLTFNDVAVVDESNPAGQPACGVKSSTKHGDWNIDITPCPPPPSPPSKCEANGVCLNLCVDKNGNAAAVESNKLPGEDYNVNAGDGAAFWLDDWNANACGGNLGDVDLDKNDFVFVAGAGYPSYGLFEFDAATKTATLKGLLAHKFESRVQFFVNLKFTGFLNPDSADYGKAFAFNDFWSSSDIRDAAAGNSSDWVYFLGMTGSLVGAGELKGYTVELEMKKETDPAHSGQTVPAGEELGFQCGVMANGKNTKFGCSAWFSRKVFYNGVAVVDVNTPANQPEFCKLKPTEKHGDINIDLWVCGLQARSGYSLFE